MVWLAVSCPLPTIAGRSCQISKTSLRCGRCGWRQHQSASRAVSGILVSIRDHCKGKFFKQAAICCRAYCADRRRRRMERNTNYSKGYQDWQSIVEGRAKPLLEGIVLLKRGLGPTSGPSSLRTCRPSMPRRARSGWREVSASGSNSALHPQSPVELAGCCFLMFVVGDLSSQGG